MGYSDTVFNILLTFRDIEIYGDICHFIRDTCLFKGYEIFGNVTPLQAYFYFIKLFFLKVIAGPVV